MWFQRFALSQSRWSKILEYEYVLGIFVKESHGEVAVKQVVQDKAVGLDEINKAYYADGQVIYY